MARRIARWSITTVLLVLVVLSSLDSSVVSAANITVQIMLQTALTAIAVTLTVDGGLILAVANFKD